MDPRNRVRGGSPTVVLSILVLLQFGAAPAVAAPTNANLGVSTSFSGSYLHLPNADRSAEIALTVSPILRVYGDALEFSCRTALTGGYATGTALPMSPGFMDVPVPPSTSGTELFPDAGGVHLSNPSLQACRLQLFPLPTLVLSAGRYSYAPGAGETSKPLSLFASRGLSGLVPFEGTLPSGKAALLQTTLFLARSYITLSAAPWRPAAELPSPDSPWFPSDVLPEEIPLGSVGEEGIVFSRGDVVLEIPEATAFDGTAAGLGIPARLENAVRRSSYGAELGTSTQYADAALMLYHGWDPLPLLRPRIRFDLGAREYDIHLKPPSSRFTALGGSVTAVRGSLRAWSDALLGFNREFVERHYVPPTDPEEPGFGLEATTQRYPSLDLSIGLSRQWPWRSVVGFIEYGGIFALTRSPRYPLADGYLAQRLALGLQGSFFDYRLHPRILSMTSLADGSTAVAVTLRYTLRGGTEIVAAGATAIGTAETELGYFGGYLPLSLSVLRHF